MIMFLTTGRPFDRWQATSSLATDGSGGFWAGVGAAFGGHKWSKVVKSGQTPRSGQGNLNPCSGQTGQEVRAIEHATPMATIIKVLSGQIEP